MSSYIEQVRAAVKELELQVYTILAQYQGDPPPEKDQELADLYEKLNIERSFLLDIKED